MAKTMKNKAIELDLIQTNYRKKIKDLCKAFFFLSFCACVCLLERDKA